jgi:ABC-type multidrug transport system permease subunit
MFELHRFLALLSARNREFLRDRTALLWNVIMPVIIVFGFAYAFNKEEVQLFKVGIPSAESRQLESDMRPFFEMQHIQFIVEGDMRHARERIERHQLDLLIDPANNRYWVNEQSPKGYVAEKLLLGVDGDARRRTLSGERIRYVDWLIPGVLAMNVMFSSLFGVGYAIVRYRRNGVLKRLKATPLTPVEFLSAQVFSRLWLIVLTTIAVYLGTDLFVDFPMFGSYWLLLLSLILGALSIISLALIVAARLANQEAANGLLNLISWPMMLLSGVWFSLEGSPEWVQLVAQLLPLTHLIQAARMIMLDGAGVMAIGHHLLILLLMSAVCIALGARLFRWE